MPTNKECGEYQKEIYRQIGGRVRRWVFLLVVASFASLLGIVAQAAWTATEKANATEVRQQEQQKAADNAQTVREKHHDESMGEIRKQLEKMDKKLDRVIEIIHERR